jgi:hypothetical protein
MISAGRFDDFPLVELGDASPDGPYGIEGFATSADLVRRCDSGYRGPLALPSATIVNARVGHDASSRFPNGKLDVCSRDDPDSRIDPAILTLGAV